MTKLVKGLIISTSIFVPVSLGVGLGVGLGVDWSNPKPILSNYVDRTLTFSENNENIIVLFTDETTGYTANKIVSDNHSNEFEGFTAYDNVTTTGKVTNTTFHSLLAGPTANVYEKNYGKYKDLTLGQYADAAYGEMINMMHQAHFDQSYVAMQWFHEHGGDASDDSLLMNTFKDQDITSINHASLNDYRSTGVKHLVTDRERMNKTEDAKSMYYLPDLIKAEPTSNPQFKFICSESTHSSYVWYDPIQDKIMGGNGNTAADNVGAVEAQMSNYGRLFDKMKELGVYDNSMIIVVSDHGAHPETAFDPKYLPSVADSATLRLMKMKSTYDWMVHNPMLMIKMPNNNDPFHIDTSRFLGNFDVPQIIAREINSHAIEDANKGQMNFEIDPLGYVGDRDIRKYGADWHFPENSLVFPQEMPISINIHNNVWDPYAYSRGNIVTPGTSIQPDKSTYTPFKTQ